MEKKEIQSSRLGARSLAPYVGAGSHRFIAKLSDCEAEAAETQVWLKFAVKCQYLDVEQGREFYGIYNQVLGGLVNMINNPERWIISK